MDLIRSHVPACFRRLVVAMMLAIIMPPVGVSLASFGSADAAADVSVHHSNERNQTHDHGGVDDSSCAMHCFSLTLAINESTFSRAAPVSRVFPVAIAAMTGRRVAVDEQPPRA